MVLKSNRRILTGGLLIASIFLSLLSSFKPIRAMLAIPLYVSNPSASGEAAYVMADGHAYWGRLSAAADLYHMQKVEKILISREETISHYNFVKKRNDVLYERAIDYLTWKGIPTDSIETVPVNHTGRLGSLTEARQLVKFRPNLRSIVIVTSAPHTRRSLLCFQRSVPDHWEVTIYSDSEPLSSPELFEPLWIEYVKLVVYYLSA